MVGADAVVVDGLAAAATDGLGDAAAAAGLAAAAADAGLAPGAVTDAGDAGATVGGDAGAAAGGGCDEQPMISSCALMTAMNRTSNLDTGSSSSTLFGSPHW
jgi:hypothetical protein